jgi:eukaryotic-like serine/threonine-protein kinase
MDQERWLQVKEILDEVIQRPPDERAAFLTAACSDNDTLYREVESLLDSYESEFLEQPAVAELVERPGTIQFQLTAGQSINRYRVISLLAVSGMGEVYLADDTSLGRKVALKLLPASFTQDEDRLRRFKQEARVASALNHPNIVTVFEVGQEGALHFIATEYIDGQTLRQRIANETLGLSELLEIAIQVAGALTTAHEARIVHRDIKPENIMLRRDGYVKVLDFGLAKLTEQPAVLRTSDVSTIATVDTDSGVLMGTVSYMSPEQARGEILDARTDIFSFGVLLYELITGRAPFRGENTRELIAAILYSEPVPLTRSQALAELQLIVSKALNKNRAERYQTAREMLNDLTEIRLAQEIESERARRTPTELEDGASGNLAGNLILNPTVEAKINPLTGKSTANRRYYLIFGVLAMVAILLMAIRFTHRATNTRAAAGGFRQTQFTRVTSFGNAYLAAISPDGKYVVHVKDEGNKQSLLMRQTNETHDIEILPPAETRFQGISVSPDNRRVYYTVWEANKSESSLYRMPLSGGSPQRLPVDIDSAVSFAPDGEKIAFFHSAPSLGNSHLIVSNADGSEAKMLAKRQSPDTFETFFNSPAWSPDGNSIVAIGASMVLGVKSGLVVVNVADGSEKSLTERRWWEIGQVGWLRDGSGLLMIAQAESSSPYQIWHVYYPSGEARKITNDLNDYRGLSLTADSKTLITTQIEHTTNLWVSASGSLEHAISISSETGNNSSGEGLAWLPDGKIIFRFSQDGQDDIWQIEKDGSERKQLTVNSTDNAQPTICAGGKAIVFVSRRTGSYRLWRMDKGGDNPRPLITDGNDSELFPHCAPDGNWVVYQKGWRNSSVWKVPVTGGKALPVVATDSLPVVPKKSMRPAVSPDGKFVAYYYMDEDVWGLAVISIEGGKTLFKFPLPPSVVSRFVRWTHDGKALAYIDTRNGVSNIWLQSLDRNSPKQLTNFDTEGVLYFDWSSDGKTFAVARGTVTSDVISISAID